MDLESFYREILQETLSAASANAEFSEIVFVSQTTDKMIEAGELNSFDHCAFQGHGLKVSGYDFDDADDTLNLFVCDYRQSPKPESLSETEVNKSFKRLEAFFKKTLRSDFHQGMEESTSGFQLAYEIFQRSESFSKVRFYLLSDAILSDRVKDVPSKEIGPYAVSFHIWDVSRLFRIEESGRGRETLEIDLSEYIENGLPCLTAHLDTSAYQSLLAVIPGDVLARIYDRHGQRLLEQNVRTFLQNRGKVNKGMRSTIMSEPEMFFAYNNGLTATAEGYELTNVGGQSFLSKVKNLQIVNGGQTTASIYSTNTKDKADLAKIFVQMKLSILDPEVSEKIVPNISRYANSQNKVSEADLFSNHPFHIRIEELSRRLWAPSAEGGLKETRWFYERARGQYANAQSRLTPAAKAKFVAGHPRSQMFTKTDLAKFEITWAGAPHKVSLGAQKNFLYFAEKLTTEWERDETLFNERYFKHAVAKAIMFRAMEKLVMKQPWYAGGYRANIVTYTLAYLSDKLGREKKVLDLDRIWKLQALPPVLEAQLVEIAGVVQKQIQDTPSNITNVTEWAKRTQCWEDVRKLNLTLNPDMEELLVSTKEEKIKKKDAKKIQGIDNGIAAQAKVIEYCQANVWLTLHEWNQANLVMTGKEQDLIQVALRWQTRLPSEKQSLALIGILERVYNEGFSVVG